MGRRPSDAPLRLVETTAKLLREQGIHATGLKVVAADARVPIGSLYFHFPGGKQELVLSALESSGAFVDSVMAQLFTDARTVRTALRSYIDLVSTLLEHSGFRSGCPLATTALEVGADNDAIAERIASSFTSWTNRVEERLRADRYRNPATLAVLIVSAIEGALVLARVKRSVEPLRIVGVALDATLAGVSMRPTR